MTRIDAIAEKLATDWQARAPYARLTGDLAPADLAEAYTVQGALQRRMAAFRGPVVGRKIALSSKAMQQMVGLDTPIGGAIFANDLHRSPARVQRASFRRLGLEYELAFEIARDVTPGAAHDRESVRSLVAAVRPAFELIEDKGADYADLCPLTLTADNAWCGGAVLGEALGGWQALDLADLEGVLEEEGQPPERGNTGAADPWGSLAWVLNHFGGRGETVGRGEHVITGSILRTRFPEAGASFCYTVAGRASVEVAVV